MIGNSTVEYIWVVAWAAILHSIGPISLTSSFLIGLLPRYVQIPRHLQYWAFAESIFFVLTQVYIGWYLQRPALHPLPSSKKERERLFELCLNTTLDHELYLSKWFFNEHLSAIKRDNVKEFFHWAFFNAHQSDSSNDDELEMYVAKLEERLGIGFPQGKGKATSLKLTLDRVSALHRSLTWYMVSSSAISQFVQIRH